MTSYMRTSTINGRYAYRAWDAQWYVVNRDGSADALGYASRQDAIAALREMAA